MLSKEKTEEPQSIAASLLAEIELKLAENTQTAGSGDDIDDNNSARSPWGNGARDRSPKNADRASDRSPKNAEAVKKKGGIGFFGSRSNSLKRDGDE